MAETMARRVVEEAVSVEVLEVEGEEVVEVAVALLDEVAVEVVGLGEEPVKIDSNLIVILVRSGT